MAEVRSFKVLPFRHFRGDATGFVIRWRNGEIVEKSRAASFYFRALNTQIAQVPVDDQELPFSFSGRSADYQEITVQGTISYRIQNPDAIKDRIDFSLDLERGNYSEDPEAALDSILSELSQQYAWNYMAAHDVETLLRAANDFRDLIKSSLAEDEAVASLGLEVISVRVTRITPKPELERSLQQKTFEKLSQEADQAQAERRRAATENEAKINAQEQANRLALEKQRTDYVNQANDNKMLEVTGERDRANVTAEGTAHVKELEARADAQVTEIRTAAEVDRIEKTSEAQVAAEEARLNLYKDLPPAVLQALALRDLAQNLHRIEHLSITPDLLASFLGGANGNGAHPAVNVG